MTDYTISELKCVGYFAREETGGWGMGKCPTLGFTYPTRCVVAHWGPGPRLAHFLPAFTHILRTLCIHKGVSNFKTTSLGCFILWTPLVWFRRPTSIYHGLISFRNGWMNVLFFWKCWSFCMGLWILTETVSPVSSTLKIKALFFSPKGGDNGVQISSA